jgi:hypothetical protein
MCFFLQGIIWIKQVLHFLNINYFVLTMFIFQVLVLVGDQLDYSDDVCGVVLSCRFNEDILSVWNRNASDHQVSHIT